MFAVRQMDQWFANLFFRKVQPSEITRMSYKEMHYWNGIHEMMLDADEEARKAAKNKK